MGDTIDWPEQPLDSAPPSFDEILDGLARSEGWLLPPLTKAEPAVTPRRREPLFVHHLPQTTRFVGRTQELALLEELYASGRTGMIAVIGIGGAGKSVLIDQFCRVLGDADGLLVWSFYVDEDPDRFLACAYRYLRGKDPPLELRGRRLADALCEALRDAGRVVLVLDGLERAQRDDGCLAADAVRDLVERIALGWGRALAIVTTRLSLVDLQHYRGEVYREIRLGELGSEDAAALLDKAGVRGADEDRAALVQRFGGHALTISLLGSALARFYDGDPRRADEVVGPGLEMLDETGKLGRVLGYYQRRLAPLDTAVLEWMTALPRSANLDFLERFMVRGHSDGDGSAPGPLRGLDHGALRGTLGRLLDLQLIQADTKASLTEYGVHAAIKSHFYEGMIAGAVAQAHEAAYRALDPQRSLAARPGYTRPTEQAAIDRVEDVIFHALRAGRLKEAYELYRRLLGYPHLGAKLGAYALGERVVRGFFPDGDPARPTPVLDATERSFLVTDLGLFLRQLGELDKATACHALVATMAARGGELPAGGLLHLAHDRLLQGSFREAQWSADQAKKLAGDDAALAALASIYLGAAHLGLGELDHARLALEGARARDDVLLVTVRVDLNLRVGKSARADAIARAFQQRVADKSFHEDHVQCHLLLAECAFALGRVAEALEYAEAAERFVQSSGWRYARCRIHLLRARAAIEAGNPRATQAELAEASRLAERHGFASLLVDALVLQGELELDANPVLAAVRAREAFRRATDHACRYRWGEADALDLSGRALVATGDRGQARPWLKQALRVRKALGNAAHIARMEAAIAEADGR